MRGRAREQQGLLLLFFVGQVRAAVVGAVRQEEDGRRRTRKEFGRCRRHQRQEQRQEHPGVTGISNEEAGREGQWAGGCEGNTELLLVLPLLL